MGHEIMELAGRQYSWRGDLAVDADRTALPIIVALHGGTYTSRYFDVPGHSLLSLASGLQIPFVALDRPGYGATTYQPDDSRQDRSAELLAAALADLWALHGQGRSGIVLIGHSIGGAIALRIAASRPTWPLLGVAVSGLGLAMAPRASEGGEGFPPVPFLDIPSEIKDMQMFGPPGTFEATAASASRVADAAVPVQELVDIVSTWSKAAGDILRMVDVPVHYRQGADDYLWSVDDEQIARFAAACSSAPWVDARTVRQAGHAIDFHRSGMGFQLEQLAFALRCAS